MRASILIGGLIASAMLLLFLPTLGGRSEAVAPRARLAVPNAPAPAEEAPSWRELLDRPGEHAAARTAASQARWSAVADELADPSAPTWGEAGERELLLGLALRRGGRPEAALGPLELAARECDRESHPLASFAWQQLAEVAAAAERMELRCEALREVAQARPDSRRVTAALARCEVEAGRPARALELVRAGEPAEPADEARAALLGVGLSVEEALPEERAAWIAELGWAHPCSSEARALAGSEAWEAELDAALAAKEWNPVLDRLEALVTADLASTALPEIEALIDADPPTDVLDRARQLEARANWVRGRHPQALSAARKVGDSDGVVLARARYVGALSARKLQRRGDYRRLLEQAAEAAPCEWRDRAIERLAEADEHAGRDVKARERWRRLAEEAVTPERRAEAEWHRAWSHFEAGATDSALAAFTQVVDRHPRRPEAAAALYWSARLLRDGGAPEEAGRRLRRLLEEHPHDYYGLVAAGELHEKAPLPPRARPGELEDLLAERLEALAARDRGSAARVAALWRLGLVGDVLTELEEAGALGDEHWALQVALLGAAGRHREALVALRSAVPDWRTRRDLPGVAWAGAYPTAFSALVERRSAEFGLDPALVYALIHQESVFDADAVSHAGARGLMQIMPGTNRTIARWFQERTRTSDLVDPEHNVRYGTAYLRRLLDNLGEPELALAGYNAGGTRARRWWSGLPERDLPLFVESIPFDETRHYVKSVTWNRHFYRGLLEPVPTSAVAQ